MAFLTGLLYILIILTSIFLICLVLIQRGKGGGLAGAFGGVGGSSAFGTKAGDIFTKITMWTAVIWIGMAMLLVLLVNSGGRTSAYDLGPAGSSSEVPVPGAATGAGAGTGTDAATIPGGLPTDSGIPSTLTPPTGGTAPAPATTPAPDATPAAPATAPSEPAAPAPK